MIPSPNSWLLVLLVTAQTGCLLAFIFPAPPALEACPAIPPCTCYGTTINCGQKNLTSFPAFHDVTIKAVSGTLGAGRVVYFVVPSNSITTVPPDAIRNVTFEGGVVIQFDLSNNKLVGMDPHAFRGVETKITSMRLDNNRLTSIPAAVGKLTSLTSLTLKGNPITSLDAGVLRAIGPSLTTFEIDYSRFTSIPSEIRYLTHVSSLTLSVSYPVSVDLLDGLRTSLITLNIEDSKIERIPEAVCHLKNLRTLRINENEISHMTSSVFDSSCMQTSILYSIELANNGLTSIPNDITSSDLDVKRVDLDHNAFTAFPRVLNVLKTVTTVTIRNNKITSLQREDLSGLVSLSGLYINDNPISYVSADAFTANVGLESLDLENTFIQTIPSSLVPLVKFKLLYIRNTHVRCSCRDMGYLKSFKSWRYQLFGTCYPSGPDINTYIRGTLQACH